MPEWAGELVREPIATGRHGAHCRAQLTDAKRIRSPKLRITSTVPSADPSSAKISSLGEYDCGATRSKSVHTSLKWEGFAAPVPNARHCPAFVGQSNLTAGRPKPLKTKNTGANQPRGAGQPFMFHYRYFAEFSCGLAVLTVAVAYWVHAYQPRGAFWVQIGCTWPYRRRFRVHFGCKQGAPAAPGVHQQMFGTGPSRSPSFESANSNNSSR